MEEWRGCWLDVEVFLTEGGCVVGVCKWGLCSVRVLVLLVLPVIASMSSMAVRNLPGWPC